MDLHEREKHTPISYPHEGVPSNSGVTTGEQSAVFNLTDLGNSNRFVEQYHDEIKYCSTSRTWIVWNGKYWQNDENALVAGLIREVVKGLQAMLGHSSLQMIYTRYYSWVRKATRNDGSAMMAKLNALQPEPAVSFHVNLETFAHKPRNIRTNLDVNC